MAINYYGSCTGSSSSKYNVWVSFSQNSQSIENNQSNVTIKFYVKRNDGYSDSAYNLNEDENSVKIKVEGTVVVSKNIEIDTRNSVSVLLASWTGNLTHGADGKLSVPITAVFSMNNKGLSSGSVSATVTCTAIPRKSTLSLSSATVNPGSSVTATVSSASSGFSHKIIWSLGNKSSSIFLTTGVLSAQLSVPVDWAYAITDSSVATVSVSLITYNGTTETGTSTYSLSFIIPDTDQYKPEFSVGLTRIDNGVPSEWSEYVQGVSKVTVSPQGLSFKYGASLAAITITVGSVSIRGTQNATFNLTESGNLTVTVAVRDTRGFLTVKTTAIEVCPYAPPSAQIMNLFRCNSVGNDDTYGGYLSTEYALRFSSVNSKNQCKITVKYKTVNDTAYSAEEVLTGSPAFFGGNISANNSVMVCYTISDGITSDGVEIFRSVSGAGIPFNIKKGGKGAAFGKFAEKDNELSIGWDLGVDGNVSIGGELNCEDVTVSCSEYAEELAGAVKYYPCVKGCFVRIRVKASTVLYSGTTYTLAYISEKPSGIFTPLSSFANYESGGVSIAGVMYKTGNVIFRSDVDVPQGTYIYISGYYIADYSE